jgi:hypothetical protein
MWTRTHTGFTLVELLDDDGFEDPVFLWTPLSGRLRIRLFALVGTVNQGEVIKRYETVFHLRNGAAQ